MNKKVWLGFVVVFVVLEVLDTIVNNFILVGVYQATASLWRPDMSSTMWIFPVVTLIESFFIALIFSKGYEGKGIAEGMRYGLYIGIMLSVGKAYATYAMIAIPYSLALRWFIYGVIEYIIAGIALALVFKEKPKTAA